MKILALFVLLSSLAWAQQDYSVIAAGSSALAVTTSDLLVHHLPPSAPKWLPYVVGGVAPVFLEVSWQLTGFQTGPLKRIDAGAVEAATMGAIWGAVFDYLIHQPIPIPPPPGMPGAS